MFGKHRVCLLLTFDVLVGSKSPKKKKKKELFLQNFFRNRMTHSVLNGQKIDTLVECHLRSAFANHSKACTLDILFRQITTFIKVCVAFVFGLQTLWLIDFTKSYLLNGLKPKNKGHTNFYECSDLMKKYI